MRKNIPELIFTAKAYIDVTYAEGSRSDLIAGYCGEYTVSLSTEGELAVTDLDETEDIDSFSVRAARYFTDRIKDPGSNRSNGVRFRMGGTRVCLFFDTAEDKAAFSAAFGSLARKRGHNTGRMTQNENT